MHIYSPSPLYSNEAYARWHYYPPPYWYNGSFVYATPWLWYDGNPHGGYNYPQWNTKITTRMYQPAPVTITMWGSYLPLAKTGTINAQFRNDSMDAITGRVQFVVTEDSLYYLGSNGDAWHNHVARDYLPNQNGEIVTIPSGDSVTITRSFTLQPSWVANRCQIITWIQNDVMSADSTKEVWQGGIKNVNTLEGIAEGTYQPVLTDNVRTIPNPCVEGTKFFFSLAKGAAYSISIYDVSGRQIRKLEGVAVGSNESVNWDRKDDRGISVNAGVYLYKFETATEMTSGKVVVR